jgi:hypothetical protein
MTNYIALQGTLLVLVQFDENQLRLSIIFFYEIKRRFYVTLHHEIIGGISILS